MIHSTIFNFQFSIFNLQCDMFISKVLLAETAEALRNGSIDVIGFVNELCDRIDANEPQVQAFVAEENRRERLLKEAAELKARFPEPQNRPLLYGIPVGVKDIFRTDGFLTKAGSELPPELFEGQEAACVTMLREGGALIAGKTVTTEFAYFEPGPTRNPYNLNHTPGGSSSGSAAGVASGFFPLALGTQTIGSVIRPAAFCGIIGFKPTYDRIPTDGLLIFSKSADHVGIFTQDVEGINLAASILCKDWRLPTLPTPNSSQEGNDTPLRPPQGGNLPVIGVPEGKYLTQVSDEGLAAFKKHAKKLEQTGYTVRRIPIFDDIETINRRHRQMIAAEFAEEQKEWFERYSDLYRPRTAELILNGQQVSIENLDRARKAQLSLRKYIADRQAPYGVDLWISPPATGEAPEGIQTTGDPIMNLPWTHTGLPTITIPAGKSQRGLPLGLQLTASLMQDEKLVVWANKLIKSIEF